MTEQQHDERKPERVIRQHLRAQAAALSVRLDINGPQHAGPDRAVPRLKAG
ncbi:hypothetical protein [Pseudomonas putida]|uniref:hypothetical protein n=1 Tax=Pseudomonas putida TaxID=303 RepID=UPI0013CEB2D8|nr:hypothetical protein [Pseudomonas putida]